MDYLASGTMTQISAKYGGSSSAVFTGNALCSVFLFAYTVLTGFGTHGHDEHESLEGAISYFAFVSAFTVAALVAFNTLWFGPVVAYIWPPGMDIVIDDAVSTAALKEGYHTAAEEEEQTDEEEEEEQEKEEQPEEDLEIAAGFKLLLEESELVATKQKLECEAAGFSSLKRQIKEHLGLQVEIEISVAGNRVSQLSAVPRKGRIQIHQGAAPVRHARTLETQPSFFELAAIGFNTESALWRVGKNTCWLQMAQVLLWFACLGVQALFVVVSERASVSLSDTSCIHVYDASYGANRSW